MSVCFILAVLITTLAPAVVFGLPQLELEKWNRAYLYEADKVPAALLNQGGAALFDGGSAGGSVSEPMFPLVGYDVKRQCKSGAVTEDPTQVKPGSCQYRANKDGTFTYWEKQPGDWARMSNCYCYALDVFKAAWCQPGAASGVAIDQSTMTCDSLKKAITADGAKEVTAAQALNTQPPSGHYIAMLLRPQSSCNFARCAPDFHFMRKDANGLWSHKAGEAPAANKDANGALIKDPKTAKISGQYTEFCGYFHVEPSKMNIGTIPVPNLVSKGVQKWKDNGLKVHVQPLAYNAAVDAVDAQANYAAVQQRQFAVQRGEAPASGNRRLLALSGSL
jgi:hypothetical protein